MNTVESALACVRVIFKNCELGVTGGLPLFRIMPEAVAAGADGVCQIASVRRATVVLGLEILEEGFAVLLDKQGQLTEEFRELFAIPGELQLVPEKDVQNFCWKFPAARLAANTGYGIMPEAGHRLLLEFELSPAGPDGGCMYQDFLS